MIASKHTMSILYFRRLDSNRVLFNVVETLLAGKEAVSCYEKLIKYMYIKSNMLTI